MKGTVLLVWPVKPPKDVVYSVLVMHVQRLVTVLQDKAVSMVYVPLAMKYYTAVIKVYVPLMKYVKQRKELEKPVVVQNVRVLVIVHLG